MEEIKFPTLNKNKQIKTMNRLGTITNLNDKTTFNSKESYDSLSATLAKNILDSTKNEMPFYKKWYYNLKFRLFPKKQIETAYSSISNVDSKTEYVEQFWED